MQKIFKMLARSASTDAISTMSARFVKPDDASIASHTTKKDPKPIKLVEEVKTNKDENQETTERRHRADTPGRFSHNSETETDHFYFREHPIAPHETAAVAPVIIRQPYKDSAPPKYNINDIEDWMYDYELRARANHWTDEDKFNNLYESFKDTIHMPYFKNLRTKRKIFDWQSAKHELLARQITSGNTIGQIQKRFQRPGESSTNYISEKEGLFFMSNTEISESEIVRMIKEGLLPRIREKIEDIELITKIDTVNLLLNKAILVESQLPVGILVDADSQELKPKRVHYKDESFQYDKQAYEPNLKVVNNKIQYMQKQMTEVSKKQDQLSRMLGNSFIPTRRNPINSNRFNSQGVNGRPISTQQNSTENSFRTPTDNTNVIRDTQGQLKCANCNKFGHHRYECTAPRRCYNCGKIGHFIADCPEPHKNRNSNSQGN